MYLETEDIDHIRRQVSVFATRLVNGNQFTNDSIFELDPCRRSLVDLGKRILPIRIVAVADLIEG